MVTILEGDIELFKISTDKFCYKIIFMDETQTFFITIKKYPYLLDLIDFIIKKYNY